MRIRLIILFLWSGAVFWGDGFLSSKAWGSSLTSELDAKKAQQYYKEGQDYQRNIVKKMALDSNIDPSLQKDKIPVFQQDPIALKNAANRQIGAESVQGKAESPGKIILSYDKAFTIDPDTDPHIVDGEKILNNPMGAVEVIEVSSTQGTEEKIERHLCYEGEESTQEKCQSRLVPKVTLKDEKRQYEFNILFYEVIYPMSAVSFPKGNKHRPPDSEILNAWKAKAPFVDAVTGKKLDIDPQTITEVEFIKRHGPEYRHYSVKKKHEKSYSTAPKFNQYRITTTVSKPTYKLEDWESDCGNLEDRADKGDCEAIEKYCIDPEKTKIIDGNPITADCWLEERRYQCSRKVKNTCKALRDRGCYQVSSKCKVYDDSGDEIASSKQCTQWEQTYECRQGGMMKIRRFSGPTPFCLDGNCHEVSWAPNGDMAESLSKLSVMNAMKSDMDPEKMTVFQGKKLQCSRNPAGFKNCCVKKGWGKKIGLTDCNKDEKELSIERAGNKCVAVGSYCKTEKLGVCIDKRTSYCCFGTRLSRILHEQGRKLIGINGFGTPKHPNCSGFTLADFKKLDLSKIDLSELFQELLSKMNAPDRKKQASQAESKLYTPEKREEFKHNQEPKNENQGAM